MNIYTKLRKANIPAAQLESVMACLAAAGSSEPLCWSCLDDRPIELTYVQAVVKVFSDGQIEIVPISLVFNTEERLAAADYLSILVTTGSECDL